MPNMLRPADIGIIQEQTLNDLAIELYDAETISTKFVFNVTADYQLYERYQKGEYEVNDNQKITPIVIARQDHSQSASTDYLRYREVYSMRAYAFSAEVADLEVLMKTYTVRENTTNRNIIESGFRITKETVDMSFDLDLEPKDGSLEKRAEGLGYFTWDFLDGIMTSYDVTISIDGVEMPYDQFSFASSTRQIASEAKSGVGASGAHKNAIAWGISMKLPYIATSSKIVEIYNDFYNKVYNKTYTLSYTDGAGVSFSYPVTISTKGFTDVRPRILDFDVTFVRVEDSVIISIDGTEVPVLSFGLNPSVELSPTQLINESRVKNKYLGDRYQINIEMDISDQTNLMTQAFLSRVINLDFGSTHILHFEKGAIVNDYTVTLLSGGYSFNEMPDSKISLVFVESADNIV